MTHEEIIDLWPSPADLARDVRKTRQAIHEWRRNGRIPPHRFDDVINAAKRRGFREVTYVALCNGLRK